MTFSSNLSPNSLLRYSGKLGTVQDEIVIKKPDTLRAIAFSSRRSDHREGYFPLGNLPERCSVHGYWTDQRQAIASLERKSNLNFKLELRLNARTNQPRIQSADRPGLKPAVASSSITLAYLFHLVTGCALFFACFRISPYLAVALTIAISPTIIRTHIVAELHRTNQLPFPWRKRMSYFGSSLCVVLLTLLLAGLAFCSVSMLFGLFAVGLGGLMGLTDLSADSAVLGTAGGMVWGIAAAFLAVCFAACKIWVPIIPELENTPLDPRSS